MRVVMKFGGTAVANGEKIKTAANLVMRSKEAAENMEIVVVTSAIYAVTDTIYEQANRIAEEGKEEKVKEFV